MSKVVKEGIIQIIGVVLIAAGWFLMGDGCGRSAIKREAIEAGTAEYIISDPATGKTEFRWRKP